jgi:hypothetical protein
VQARIILSIMVIFTIILFVTPSVFAEYQILRVEAGDSESLKFYLEEGDSIKFDIRVEGGSNDDINLDIQYPNGALLNSSGVVLYTNGEFWAEVTGYYTFEFNNEFSYVSSKTITFTYDITEKYIPQTTKNTGGGGCLIATATYGSEMSQQVQQLRELRDNQLLQTESGSAFMSTFNDIYYSFSPTIADYERENPLFKEVVKVAITPMISSLSLMENANSESEVISLGLSVIMLNLGMYLGVPAVVIVGIRKRI